VSRESDREILGRIDRIVGHIMNKKGEDIVVIDVRGVTSIADFFIVATGNSGVHVKAISDEIREKLKREEQAAPWHVEGEEGRRWILVDYVDIVVHVFDSETRRYFDIEKLYEDAESRRVETDY
jgi:ribosome-associated protein